MAGEMDLLIQFHFHSVGHWCFCIPPTFTLRTKMVNGELRIATFGSIVADVGATLWTIGERKRKASDILPYISQTRRWEAERYPALRVAHLSIDV